MLGSRPPVIKLAASSRRPRRWPWHRPDGWDMAFALGLLVGVSLMRLVWLLK